MTWTTIICQNPHICMTFDLYLGVLKNEICPFKNVCNQIIHQLWIEQKLYPKTGDKPLMIQYWLCSIMLFSITGLHIELTHSGWVIHICVSKLGHLLAQIMACCLIGTKPLSELVLPYCQLDFKEHIAVKLYLNSKVFAQENAQNVVWKTAAMSRLQCVEYTLPVGLVMLYHGSPHICLNGYIMYRSYIDGLVQDCSISSVLAMEILQSCTKPKICQFTTWDINSGLNKMWPIW